MVVLTPEFVVDKNARKRAVIVSLDQWQQVMEELEELEDIRAYDKAKAEPEDAVPFDEAIRQIKAKAKK